MLLDLRSLTEPVATVQPRTQLQPVGLVGKRYGSFDRPPGKIEGTSALQFGATGAMTAAGRLVGASALTFDSSLVVNRRTTQLQPVGLVGRQYGSFSHAVISSISGAAALAFDGSGPLTGIGALSGVSAITLGGTGILIDDTSIIISRVVFPGTWADYSTTGLWADNVLAGTWGDT